MIRALIMAYWETRRILRSKFAMTCIISLPLLLAAIRIALVKWPESIHIAQLFPLLAVLATIGLITSRYLRDRTSGFAAAVRSTPSSEAIVTASRVITCVSISLIQSAIFFGLTRMALRQ